jgi:hypothetical protein
MMWLCLDQRIANHVSSNIVAAASAVESEPLAFHRAILKQNFGETALFLLHSQKLFTRSLHYLIARYSTIPCVSTPCIVNRL